MVLRVFRELVYCVYFKQFVKSSDTVHTKCMARINCLNIFEFLRLGGKVVNNLINLRFDRCKTALLLFEYDLLDFQF